MKRIKLLLAVLLALSLLLAGCASKDAPLSDGVWETVCGSYAWDESSQYTNSVLSLMWLDYGCVLFEFNLMEGSEEEDSATELTVSGVLNVQEDGSGIYEIVIRLKVS